jgi:hypothetical protein
VASSTRAIHSLLRDASKLDASGTEDVQRHAAVSTTLTALAIAAASDHGVASERMANTVMELRPEAGSRSRVVWELIKSALDTAQPHPLRDGAAMLLQALARSSRGRVAIEADRELAALLSRIH